MSLETLRMRPDIEDPLPVPKPTDPPPSTNSGGTCTALDRQADPGDEPSRPKPEKLRTIAVASRERLHL
ncbi:MAG: hypothetical protein ACKO6N_20995 [Myxococcota bacterium]